MSLPDKLKITKELPFCLLNAPDEIIGLLTDYSTKTKLPNSKIDQVLFFAKNKMMLEENAPAIMNTLNDGGLLWIAYPKKTGAIQSDLTRDDGWAIMFQSDWEGVASISINDDWSGIRFRHKKSTSGLKRLPPMEERKVEGVDYINRDVTLPEDAKIAVQPYDGLEVFFNSMSFTHKREYVEAIAEAKKPETRQRRIDKMVEMLLKLQEKKLKK